MLILFGCSSTQEDDYTDTEEQISKAFGLDMLIVEPESHSLTFAKLHSKGPFDEKIEKATLAFSKIEGEKELSKTDEEINQEEDSLNFEYIYGPYDGEANFLTTITVKDMHALIDPNMKFRPHEQNGYEMQYIERKNNQLIVRAIMDDVVYKIEVTLNDHLTKQDVFDYMEKVIAEVNN